MWFGDMQNLSSEKKPEHRAFVGHISRTAEVTALSLGANALSDNSINADAVFVIVGAVREDSEGATKIVTMRWVGCGACLSAALGQETIDYLSDQILKWTGEGHECEGHEGGGKT